MKKSSPILRKIWENFRKLELFGVKRKHPASGNTGLMHRVSPYLWSKSGADWSTTSDLFHENRNCFQWRGAYMRSKDRRKNSNNGAGWWRWWTLLNVNMWPWLLVVFPASQPQPCPFYHDFIQYYLNYSTTALSMQKITVVTTERFFDHLNNSIIHFRRTG